jgi:replication factor C subunit 2/4
MEGWSAAQILIQLHDKVIKDDEAVLSEVQKSAVSCVLSEADKRLNDGSDEHLEILNLLMKIAKIII